MFSTLSTVMLCRVAISIVAGIYFSHRGYKTYKVKEKSKAPSPDKVGAE